MKPNCIFHTHLIHQFFLMIYSVSVFQEGIVIVLSSFSSTFDKVHPSPWKTDTVIVSLVISAPLFFVFLDEMIVFFFSDEKCYQMAVCVHVCVCVHFLICCCWRLSYQSYLDLSVIYGCVIMELWLCVGDRNYLNVYSTFISDRELWPDLWTNVLLSLWANVVYFISDASFPNSTKSMDIQRKTFDFCWQGCFWLKCCLNCASIWALCATENIPPNLKHFIYIAHFF